MDHCHHHLDAEVVERDRRIVWTVLLLNFSMFFVEVWFGLKADSTSLIADSMDFLSDSFNYAITLYVLTRSLRMRAVASLIKAGSMLLMAAATLGQGVHNIIESCVPHYQTMGGIGMAALIVNVICTVLLYRSRGRDSNMQSIWLCSRNDAIGNILIVIAAGLVYMTGTLWPDLGVALIIAWLATSSAFKVIAEARKELKHEQAH